MPPLRATRRIHACHSPSDDPATAFRYTSVNRKDRAERLEADLTAAVEEVVSSGRLQSWLDRIAVNRLPRWSFSNQMLALMQIHGRRDQLASETGQKVEDMPPVMVMTARAWEREFGRHPRGGESAVWINGPRTRKVDGIDPKTGQEREEFRVVGVTPVAEFDITQTEGPDLPDVDIAKMTDGKVRPGSRTFQRKWTPRHEESSDSWVSSRRPFRLSDVINTIEAPTALTASPTLYGCPWACGERRQSGSSPAAAEGGPRRPGRPRLLRR